MPRLLLTLLVCWVVFGTTHAQGTHFEKDSLTQVFAKARQLNKPVLVLLAPSPMPARGGVAPQLSLSERALNAPAVAAVLNKDFLNKKLVFGSAEIAAVARKYTVMRYPTYLYFSPDGSLLYRSVAYMATEQSFLNDIQAFRQAQANPQNLSAFNAQFRGGSRSVSFLKQYIDKCREMGQLVEPELLDAYVQQLPAKAFDRAAEVVFVLDNGPVVGSKAQLLTRRNARLYDSLYRALPLAQRIAINNLIISNTMAQAIALHDRKLAVQGAEFARRSWGNNERGTRALEEHMLDFYSGTKDTANYLRAAVDFYERNYMAVSADSAKKVVASLQAFRQQQASSMPKVGDKIGALGAGGTGVVRQMVLIGQPESFLKELNNGAQAVYETGTRNRRYLQPALQWSQRTVTLDPIASHRNTLAHLLYRLQAYGEAEAMQQQALVAARQENEPTAAYEQELAKMKLRTL